MRLCRFYHEDVVQIGFFDGNHVVSLPRLAAETKIPLEIPSSDLLHYLPPNGLMVGSTRRLFERWQAMPPPEKSRISVALRSVKLLVPIAEPKKIILLAGNYAEHIKEGGGQAAEREDTFPYFFWKPPSTTMTHPGDPIRIPAISPHHVDWELELGVIIGKRCTCVAEADALAHVAAYTVCNDISDRKFQLNPGRKKREKDGFFDWLHGKWHDTFMPMGPCVLPAAAGTDPQKWRMKLSVNGQVMQDASTGQMVFPVAALVSILSSFVTLEPGDIISTGTPSGVGHARKPAVYLKNGDMVEAEIEGIGVLRNPVIGP